MKLCNSPLCSDGFVFDTVVSQMVTCPLCADIRKREVLNGVSVDEVKVSLAETLGLRRIFNRLSFDLKSILGSTYDELKSGFRSELSTTLENLIGFLSTGKTPSSSMLIYLGSQADVELLAFQLLGSAYKAGLVVHPFVTPYRLQRIKRSLDDYDNLIKSDVVVVTFSPSLREDGYLVEDLVKQRAYEGKSTYVVLSDGVGLNSLIARLCSSDGTSLRKCVYVGIPNLTLDEVSRVKKVNAVIRNSNKVLGIGIPEVVLEDEVGSSKVKPKGAPAKSLEKAIYR